MAENEEKNLEEAANPTEDGHVDISEEEAEAKMLEALEAEQSTENVSASIADFPQFDESKKKGFFEDDKLEFLKDLQLNVYIAYISIL